MRFGVKTAPQHTTWSDMLEVWRAADDIELFESAWNFDHFYPIFSDSDGPCLEAWTMLAAMAQATERIRVGCQVTGMVYRHPAVLANMAATVDIIANGRLDVGLGAGWNQQECDAYGIDLPPLKERFDRFDEGVEAIIMLLSQEYSDLDGQYVQAHPRAQRTEARATAAPADRHRRQRSEPHPAHRCALRPAVELDLGHRTVAGVEGRFSRSAAPRSDAIRRPSNARSTFGTTTRQGATAVADAAAAFKEAGADIVIVGLPIPHTPRVLEPIADALRPLA